MNKGEVDYAVRKAMEVFDSWNDTVGIFTPGTGYYAEIQGIIEDAAHCGMQMAIHKKIDIYDERVVRGK